MANKPLNSVAGFSVGANTIINVIDANGNVTANFISASSNATISGTLYSNNIILSGGNVDFTDSANIQFASITVTGNANVTTNTITGNLYANSGVVKAQYLIGDGSNITNIAIAAGSYIVNGTSNASLDPSGNFNVKVAGVANVLQVTGTGANITGTANISGNANIGNVGAGNIVVTQLLTAGNANITGNLNATGNANITGNFFAGSITLNGNGDINLSGTSSNINGANIINANYANISTNITAGNINGGNLVQANYITGNGVGITGLLLTSSLSDVVITSPSLSQVLGYNGVNWVNQNQSSTVSAGASVNFWFTSPQILAGPTTNNFANIQTLLGTPNTTAVSYVSGVIPSGVSEVFAVFETGSLNRTQLDAGQWAYSIWSNANATSGGAPSIAVSQYITTPYAGTITITGTGTSRTATATGSTPFATATASSNVSLASYLQTPNALMQITAIANSTSATVTTTSGYVNESAVSINVLDNAFYVGAATLTATLTAYNFTTTQGATALANTTIGLATVIASINGGSQTKNVSVTLNGTTTSSTVQTPLVTLHDNLAGLQGGAAEQYFHLTTTEYTGSGSGTFIRQTSPTLILPNIGNATGIGLAINNSGTGNISADNANLGNLVIANYFSGAGNLLSNIYGPNVSGTVANANYSAYSGNVSNGTSNVSIPVSGGNINHFAAGNNTMIITGTGVNVSGTLNATGNANVGNLGTATAIITTGNITTINSGLMQNGNSNITITANANITHFITGNATSQLTIANGGTNTAGYANIVGNANIGNLGTAQVLASANVTAPQLISNIATGTAPFIVTSTTTVANLFAANATTASNATNVSTTLTTTGTGYIPFISATATGNYPLQSNANFSANLANGYITATGFVGNGSSLTGITNIVNGNSNVSIPTANGNVNIWSSGTNKWVFDTTGNLTTPAGILLDVNSNISNANIITANYLVASSGCVTVGTSTIFVSGSTAGLFNVGGIANINIGLSANVELGSASGTVTINNTLSANGNIASNANITASGNITATNTVSAANVAVGDLYSSRPPVSVGIGTVIVDQFPLATYRSAKYTIKAGSDYGYQALEVLLVHDSINSIITVYGSLSTYGSDLVTLTSNIGSGNVQLYAQGLYANTVVNLLGTYVPD